MTQYYQAYLSMLATRDQAMVTLCMMAVALVLAFSIQPFLPSPLNSDRVRRLGLAGGMALYCITVALIAWSVA